VTDYDSLPGINFSTLCKALTSPRAYQWAVRRGYRDTPSMRGGRAQHCAVLEPERFATAYGQALESGSTKAGKAERAIAAETGRALLTATEWERVTQCSMSLREHAECRRYLDALFATELGIDWELGGVACKGRLDGLATVDGALVLLGIKTTRELARFARTAQGYRYPMQWAWYHDGMDARGQRPGLVVELVVETAPPYDAACFIVPDAVLELGRADYTRALRVIAECEAGGTWPGAYPGATLLTLPEWAYTEEHPDTETDTEEEW
jgi:exodeoxyribonuclease VIII